MTASSRRLAIGPQNHATHAVRAEATDDDEIKDLLWSEGEAEDAPVADDADESDAAESDDDESLEGDDDEDA